MFLHAIAIDPSQRGGCPVGAPHFAQVVDVEQQPPVAGAPHLVQLHHAGLDVRPLPFRFALQPLRLRAGRGQLLLHVARIALNLRELFDLDRAIDFELAQFGEHAALLLRQRLGLALQRRQPLRGAAAPALPSAAPSFSGGGRAVRRLTPQARRHIEARQLSARSSA